MSGIYLLLGSNIGRRLKNLDRAKELIVSNGITIKKESQIYETAAWGNEDQEAFLNQVIEIETKKSPQRLLQITQLIENEMGRVRYEKWGKRLIDIDILYFNDLIFQENDLSLPHPGIADRRFTLVPLVEIASEMVHPVLEKTQAELLSVCEDQLEVSVFDQY
ncbi:MULTISPECIES: 2-amino-4-hydroxy-6-hydroxymethyldihydropteridine diphosphokinase [Roseivirga]|mgnify:FL=1|uniref:2-amino-4-hydroxy-6-hydroxymethyldihydropteridine pyrophosphokinase n=2 Tax=Roseivirga spongicola TaxID=333140 RepID=A0A150X9E3_9BACT|nr:MULTISPECIES: 2-amino-4-hydroxy-6-hydroxymethyldihydropteridine diphosphokinase [Roseivirga]KYG75323.1 2-amino-4-hydroxy-6-hydroxymethyldihydropteridine pyrophosphokinase [Roseivirga spongicola]MBO6661885.1 2-amino-4-hydroxy-6-hydroxymethyldihydropteridine diphosphokinase [Roseivirga sp.]MBO6761079.1 2-amino-4-hydroxy-6-hydroxymethyldihydropteridine diphosphokinase [Roseivirga sp.]MBO6909526.1 2-amino-4-hydroxy-6-hydroxymethyldihydropteridine diphosphokinase [Roseivirga sp.]WPZ08686.1 2-ami